MGRYSVSEFEADFRARFLAPLSVTPHSFLVLSGDQAEEAVG
jgi:hypothetical protein